MTTILGGRCIATSSRNMIELLGKGGPRLFIYLRRMSVYLAYRGIVSLCVLLLFCLQASAQKCSVSGYVTDAKTHEPLRACMVRLQGSEQGTYTDSTGYYKLVVNRSAVLQYVFVGYTTQTKKIEAKGSTLRCDVALREERLRIEDVVVTGSNAYRSLKESAMPISIIGARQLQGTASSINDVLARTVGVTVRNTGGLGSSSRISVRGLEGKRMGLFVDGAAMNQVSNFVSLNDIPTNMIDHIEVYKGLVPYKFGGSALGGAVNVVTKEYPPVYLDGSYEVGSFNTHQLSSVLKRSLSKAGLQFGIGGVYSYSDNDYRMRLQNLDNRRVRRDHDKFSKLILGGSIKATKWWFDEIKTEFVYSKTRNEVQGIDLPIREAYNYSESFLVGLTMKRQNFFLKNLDFDLDAGANAGRYGLVDKASQRYDWDGNTLPPVSVYGGEQGSFPSDGNNYSFDAMAKLNLGYNIDEHHGINLNLYGSYTSQRPEDKLMDMALGFSANYPSTMNHLTLGFSYDLNLLEGRLQNAFTLKSFYYGSTSRAMDVFSISVPAPIEISKHYWGFNDAIRYRLTKQFMLKGSFNSEVRIPTSEELIGNGYSILPSPALRPERTTGVNLGALYQNNSSDGILEVELNAFYNVLHDMVRFSPDMIPTMARYRNFGDVCTMGVELEAKADISRYWYAYANATYQDLRDVRKTLPGTEVPNPTYDKRIPNVPYLLGNMGIEYHRANLLGGTGQYTRIFADASYVHQYYYDFEMSRYQDRKIPTSLLLDAAIEHSFGDHRWTITFKVKNLLDREVFSELNRPLPGRNVALKVRYLFR